MSQPVTVSESDQAFADLCKSTEDALVVAKEASVKLEEAQTALKQANTALEAAQAEIQRKDRIIEEKAALALPDEAVETLVTELVASKLAGATDATQLITDLKSPANLVKLASHLTAELAKFSMTGPTHGTGIAKEASTLKPSDPVRDEWRKVIEEGA